MTRHGAPSRAFTLVEILVATALLTAMLLGLLTLISSGRRTAEYEAAGLHAITLADHVAREVARLAAGSVHDLPTTDGAVPALTETGAAGSVLLASYLADLGEAERSAPGLRDRLQNCRLAVAAADVDGLPHSKLVTVTVSYRLSPASPTWHKVTVPTVVTERVPW